MIARIPLGSGLILSPALRVDEAALAIRNSVRIIGGVWRGRRITFPDGEAIRPTPDRVRETVFNWLQNEVAAARCLDLFAGSGALGLEALSRGAAETVFVEKSPPAARSIALQLAQFAGVGRVVEMGVQNYLAAPAASRSTVASSATAPFNLVFLDPPFGQLWLQRILPLLAAGRWVATGGIVYLECERSAGPPALPAHWELYKSKFAGEVGYHLARVNKQPAT